MAYINEVVQFETQEVECFELFVCKDGSVNISEFGVSTHGHGAMLTISPEDWDIIVKFVKRQQKQI